MGGPGSGQHDNRQSKYQVAEVCNGDGLPVYVTMQLAQGESFAAMAWSCRHLFDNPLARWLRTLDAPPRSRVVLGLAVQLARRAAWLLMRFRREQIARMAGSWPEPPDFALWSVCRGGRDRFRPVCRVRGQIVERFASVEQAARAIRSSRDDVEKRIDNGHRDSAGWSWWEYKPQTAEMANRA